MTIKSLIALAFVTLLSACGSANPTTNPLPNPPGGGNPGGGGTTPPATGQCANTLSRDITVPSRLANGPAACDYLLTGFVYIKSLLVIEPGVVVKADKDAVIWIEGGDLIAAGTANARITLEGFSPLQGYWDGINISTRAGEVRLEYVDIKDAGQTCATSGCRPAALSGFGGGQVTLRNSSISNSFVNGAILEGWLVGFSDNRFYNNRWHGLVIDADRVGLLDKPSDYVGGVQPNGLAGIRLFGASQVTRPVTWKKLGAPYFLSSYVEVSSVLTLEPGVKLIGDGGWLDIDVGGTLLAIGTAAEPIEFTGITQTPGAWDGIQFSVYNTGRDNRLEYVKLSYGGGARSELVTNGLITNYSAGIYIANSSIQHSSRWGISCSDPDAALVKLGPNNSFGDNAFGDVDPDCNPITAATAN